jgi:hypothetical protein
MRDQKCRLGAAPGVVGEADLGPVDDARRPRGVERWENAPDSRHAGIVDFVGEVLRKKSPSDLSAGGA